MVLGRLAMQKRPRIRRGQRRLDRMRIDFGGELDGFLDRLFGLTGQTEDEGAVDNDAEFVAVLGKRRATSTRMPFLML